MLTLIFYLCTNLIVSCDANLANQTMPQNMYNFEKFDIDNFNENKDIGNFHKYDFADGTFVTDNFVSDKSGYHRRVGNENSQFLDYIRFYSNGNIRTKGKYYKNEFSIGVWEFYNEDGLIEKTVDWDVDYKYSWSEIEKFLTKNEVDIDSKHTKIMKTKRNDMAVWNVSYLLEPGTIRVLILDSNIGNILEDTTDTLSK